MAQGSVMYLVPIKCFLAATPVRLFGLEQINVEAL